MKDQVYFLSLLKNRSALFILLCLVIPAVCFSQPRKDAHRPSCSDENCEVVRNFIRSHYCGKSPYGNGPAASCEIHELKEKSLSAKTIAEYLCTEDQSTGDSLCKQKISLDHEGEIALLDAMHKAGLPIEDDRLVVFSSRKDNSSGWLLEEAYFQRSQKDRLTVCQIVAAVSPEKKLYILKTLRFQKTETDVPTITQWSPVDIVDINGMRIFILRGDAYENHWFEALTFQDGAFQTVFSGLGYYL